MKKLTVLLALIALPALSLGCADLSEDNDPGKEWCTDCQTRTTVSGLYVSGHLGNYMDCPGDGFVADASYAEPDVAAGAAAPCEAGDDSCGGPLNCEDGQVTIRLTNTGQARVTGLQIERLELFDLEGTARAVLPLIKTADIDGGQAFDGTLEPGEEVTLRVDFQGPEDAYSLLNTSGESGDARWGSTGTGILEVTVTGDNHDDVKIESGEISSLPSMAT